MHYSSGFAMADSRRPFEKRDMFRRKLGEWWRKYNFPKSVERYSQFLETLLKAPQDNYRQKIRNLSLAVNVAFPDSNAVKDTKLLILESVDGQTDRTP